MSDNMQKREKSFPALQIIIKKWFIILLVAVVFFGLALTYSVLKVHPTYTAKASVVLKLTVSDQGASENSNNATLVKKNLPTVKASIESNRTITLSNQNYNTQNEKTGENIQIKSVSVEHDDKSMIFSIAYTDKTPADAKAKLKAVIESSPAVLSEVIEAETVDLVLVQNYFDVYTSDSSVTFVAVGTLIGVALGVALVFLIYALDNTVKDREELEELTGVSILSCLENK